MEDPRLLRIAKQIKGIKEELMGIGEMRPGSLSKQYRDAKEKKWGFYQPSYTHKMKSRTNYVRADQVADLRAQIKHTRGSKSSLKAGSISPSSTQR